jgi:TRAP-type transport system periplasmic protein
MNLVSKNIRIFAQVAALASVVLTSSAAHSAEAIVWRMGHTLSLPGSLLEVVTTKEVPQRIAKASGGLIKVQPLIGVIKADDVLTALQENRIQVGTLTLTYAAATHPLWGASALPGFLEYEDVDAFSNKIMMPLLKEDFGKWSSQPVLVGGYMGHTYYSNVLIDKLEKFKGVQFRTDSPTMTQMITALGGAAVGMTFPELYPALERKLVDAYTTMRASMYYAGLGKVTKYAQNWPSATPLYSMMVSDKALAALPANVRQAVLNEFAAIQKDLGQRLYAEMLDLNKKVQTQGLKFVNVPEAERRRALIVAKEHVWKPWLEKTGSSGKELVERTFKELGKKQ